MKRSGFIVRFPLVVKLIAIISLIVLLSMSVITALATWFFSNDSRLRAEEHNLTLSEMTAFQMENVISSIHSASLSLLDTLRESGRNRSFEQIAISNFFTRNPLIAYIGVPGEWDLYNRNFFTAYELEQDSVIPFIAGLSEESENAAVGERLLLNASPQLGIPSAALLVPYRDSGSRSTLQIVFSTEELQSIVQTNSANLIYAVGYDGDILAHSDYELLNLGVNYSRDPVVAAMLGSTQSGMQSRYIYDDGKEYLGSFMKIELGLFAIISTIPLDTVYAAALGVARQNLYITGIVLLFSILAVWFFSKTVSRPVMLLVQASKRIEEGNYNLDIKPSSRDELGLLTESFTAMGKGLAERERIKETFGKFVNKEIAEKALKGSLALGGSRKNATIFFSDIRDFTSISERLAPEAVVEFLNAYLTRMVTCIEKTGGVVDKFIGDAIMAVWGAPISKGTPAADALECIKTMLMMRISLHEYNKDRGSIDKPRIRIGCGVNTGPCLAGQIGSAQRMEYTVIGDSVNLASRIEGLNKAFCTDILVSEYTYDLVKDYVIAEVMPPIKVKGKAEPLRIYAIINLKNVKGPQSLSDVRALLGLSAPTGSIDTDKEEIKYEILPE